MIFNFGKELISTQIIDLSKFPKSKDLMTAVKKMMHFLARLIPSKENGENTKAVTAFHIINTIKEISITGIKNNLLKISGRKIWPVIQGKYIVGDPQGLIAICTLTNNDLMEPASKLKNVAIAGRAYTPNLGIEKIIQNVTANSNIRFLLLCGKDSPVFHPGQALISLFREGIDDQKRIINAIGHYPVLRNLKRKRIATFLKQVKLIDCTGETSLEVLQNKIDGAMATHKVNSRDEKISKISNGHIPENPEEKFIEIKPGGQREPIGYDDKGFFVISIDHKKKQIIVKHYYNNNKPGYIIKGHSSQSILLALLRENLISQLSHASYLGVELAKAEAAIKLSLLYEQDQPLRGRQILSE